MMDEEERPEIKLKEKINKL